MASRKHGGLSIETFNCDGYSDTAPSWIWAALICFKLLFVSAFVWIMCLILLLIVFTCNLAGLWRFLFMFFWSFGDVVYYEEEMWLTYFYNVMIETLQQYGSYVSSKIKAFWWMYVFKIASPRKQPLSYFNWWI